MSNENGTTAAIGVIVNSAQILLNNADQACHTNRLLAAKTWASLALVASLSMCHVRTILHLHAQLQPSMICNIDRAYWAALAEWVSAAGEASQSPPL